MSDTVKAMLKSMRSAMRVIAMYWRNRLRQPGALRVPGQNAALQSDSDQSRRRQGGRGDDGSAPAGGGHGFAELKNAGIHVDILELPAARALNPGYLSRLTRSSRLCA